MISIRGITKNKWIYHLVKSDRINALRKQYDAFLEEDKKRKERNDFILGRLDKMRYASALVPVRHKLRTYEIRPPIVDRPGLQPEFSSVRDFQSTFTNQRQQLLPDIQVKNNEETYLFQEISKKYILIPKLTTTFTNNSISYVPTDQNPERLQNMLLDQDTVPIKELKPDYHENTDWKSKYEILNILKNEEKGKPSGNDQTGFVELKQSIRKESSLGNNHEQVAINCDNYVNADVHVAIPKEHVNDYPEKDLTAAILCYDVPQDSVCSLDNTARVTGDLVAKTGTSENDNIFVANVEQTDAIGDQLQNITLNYQHSDVPNFDVPREVTNYDETQPEPDINMISTTADVCSKQTEENVNIQDVYPVEDGSVIHDQNVAVEQHEPADSEQVVYVNGYEINPMQALNYNSPSTLDVNDGILENESFTVQMKKDETDIPQEQIYLKSNIETVEQTEPVIEHAENQINVTESIQDFDAEQREMFYSEQTDKNYPTQHGDMEHPENFSGNQIPQNQEYAYYENTGAEAYPAEEDVTQQYDPSYDQQYTGLDQGSEREQYGEQYREHEGFTNVIEPQFEDLQYEQQFESRQQIEEILDVEDGYTAPKSEAPAVEIPRDEKPVETDKSDNKIKPVVTNN